MLVIFTVLSQNSSISSKHLLTSIFKNLKIYCKMFGLLDTLTTTVGGRSFQKQRERLTLSVTITNTGKKQMR